MFKPGDPAYNKLDLGPERTDEICHLLVSGELARVIAKKFGVSRTWVYGLARSRNIKTDYARACRRGAVERPRIKTAVDGAFVRAWTPASAWFWGLWFGDGWIRRKQCCLSGNAEVLGKVKAASGCRGVLTRGNNCYTLHLGGAWLSDHVQDLFGISPGRKARVLRWPQVPPDMMHHFVRGLWDSDGSFWLERGRLFSGYASASKNFLESFSDILVDYVGIGHRNVTAQRHGMFIIRLAQKNTRLLGEWMYKGSDERLRDESRYLLWSSHSSFGVA